MRAFAFVINFCIALFMSVMTIHAEQNLCAECRTEQTDSVNIRKVGFGYEKNKAKAEELAQQAARDSLLEVLRDSVATICAEVEVKSDKSGEYLSIKFFSKNEVPSRYYFTQDGILTDINVVCKESVCVEKKKYKACCVLSASKKNFTRAANAVMFRILGQMSMFMNAR